MDGNLFHDFGVRLSRAVRRALHNAAAGRVCARACAHLCVCVYVCERVCVCVFVALVCGTEQFRSALADPALHFDRNRR